MYKQKSLYFPDVEVVAGNELPSVLSSSSVMKTREQFRDTLSVASSLCRYVTEKHRTKELGRQIVARREALDAEIAAGEEQLRIEFGYFQERLKTEYETKYKLLEIELEKERAQMEDRLLRDEAAYSEFARASRAHKQMFELADSLCRQVGEKLVLIQSSEDAERLKHNKYYIKLCEEHRLLASRVTEILKVMI